MSSERAKVASNQNLLNCGGLWVIAIQGVAIPSVYPWVYASVIVSTHQTYYSSVYEESNAPVHEGCYEAAHQGYYASACLPAY